MSTPPSSGVSLHPDDLIDAPLGPGQLIVWDEEADGYIDLFDWPEHAVADEQPTQEPRDISAVIISSFQTRFEKLPDATFTVATWLDAIRDGQVADPIAQIRAARGTPRYDALKRKLRCATWAGQFPSGRKHNDPFSTSGLVFLELDHHDGPPPQGWLEAEQVRLAANPGVAAIYKSAGGLGLHVVAAVDPAPASPSEYRQAWGWLTRELAIEEYGDVQVKHHGRLAAVSHDPNAYRNLEPTPIRWEPNGFANAGRSAENSRRYTPDDIAEAFRRVAAHYGVEWTGTSDEDCKAGFRMRCGYHGGRNPTSLHVWQGELETKKKKRREDEDEEPVTVPILRAYCHSRQCPGPVVLRFLAREAGIVWPTPLGWSWPANPEDALSDTLDLLRLNMRTNRGSGQIEIRPWEGFEPDRIIAEAGIPYRRGWASIGGSVLEQAIKILARQSFKLEGNAGDWLDAFVVSASASPFSGWPFRDYLDGLPKWDGRPRLAGDGQQLAGLFTAALQAEDTELNRTAAKAFMAGAVRRTYEPGCPHDWVPVLVGAQGLGKSRFCRAMLPPDLELSLFAEDLDLSQSPQQLGEGIGGAVIAEFSEMAGIRTTRAVEGFKSFVSARQDRYRRPYARAASENPRSWVGIGTTNSEAVPADPSGSRRYVVVEAGDRANWDYLPANRDQLWAEAVAIYQDWVDEGSPNPPPNLLPEGLREAQELINSMFTGIDADFDDLAERLQLQAGEFTGPQQGVKILKLWERAHALRTPSAAGYGPPPVPPLDRSAEMKFGQALTVYGWRKARYKGVRVWYH